MKIICITSYPRTGSNRVCEVIKRIPKVDSKYEIFHPENAWGIRAEEIVYINSRIGTSFKVEDHSNDPDFSKFRQRRPSEFLGLVSEFSKNSGYSALVFKIFEGHLSQEKLLSIMRTHQMEFVFLTRNTIDMYISLVKASVVGEYSKINTTKIRPRVSATNYLRYQEKMINWYSSCFLLAARISSPIVMRYEDIFSSEGSEVKKIGDALLPFNIGIPKIAGGDSIKRQDLTSDWKKKIANPNVIEDLLLQKSVVLDMSELLCS